MPTALIKEEHEVRDLRRIRQEKAEVQVRGV